MAAYPFRVLIDGECPLCRREARILERLDKGRGRLVLEDITSPRFDAAAIGCTFEQVMGSIHGVGPDGRVVSGMEVFRRAYGAVGLGWALAPTGWPGLKWAFDALYRLFAANRLRFTGRSGACATGRCAPSR